MKYGLRIVSSRIPEKHYVEGLRCPCCESEEKCDCEEDEVEDAITSIIENFWCRQCESDNYYKCKGDHDI